ncbi:MAG TPA: hypothetical protein VFW96_10150 [Thermomicrobiales bacterium]|nr:hypothetical protein [Thermomicrobiales bacterium]
MPTDRPHPARQTEGQQAPLVREAARLRWREGRWARERRRMPPPGPPAHAPPAAIAPRAAGATPPRRSPRERVAVALMALARRLDPAEVGRAVARRCAAEAGWGTGQTRGMAADRR